MARISLLVQQTPCLEDGNYLRLATAISGFGHDVTLLSVDSLRLRENRVIADGCSWQDGMQAGESFPALTQQIIDDDLLWVLSIGNRVSFLDKMQLLQALPRHVQVINSLDALMHLKSKYLIAASPDKFKSPETHASPDADELAAIVREQGGKWIAKPPAGSLGRDVFLLTPEDNNLMAVLQHLCGPDNDQYTMIQRYVPEIEQGEKRVLLAAGQVVGQYLRHANSSDHRTNVSQGAQVEACSLTPDETQFCDLLGTELIRHGAVFAALDLVYPYLIEVNVINPGGITTIDEITGEDLSQTVAERIIKHLL